MKTNIVLPDIPESELTPLVKSLLLIIEQLLVQNQQQAEEIERLKDEINILKGQKKRPVFEGSKLDKKINAKNAAAKRKKKRPGSKKITRHRNWSFTKTKSFSPTYPYLRVPALRATVILPCRTYTSASIPHATALNGG